MRAILAVALLLATGCSGPSSRDYRRDQQALTRVFAADAHTAELADPLIARVGTGHEAAVTAAGLEGAAEDAAGRALRLARDTKVVTAEGRALRRELQAAVRQRQRVLRAFAKAARSERAEEVLDAITAARELEERFAALDDRLEALSKRSH